MTPRYRTLRKLEDPGPLNNGDHMSSWRVFQMCFRPWSWYVTFQKYWSKHANICHLRNYFSFEKLCDKLGVLKGAKTLAVQIAIESSPRGTANSRNPSLGVKVFTNLGPGPRLSRHPAHMHSTSTSAPKSLRYILIRHPPSSRQKL